MLGPERPEPRFEAFQFYYWLRSLLFQSLKNLFHMPLLIIIDNFVLYRMPLGTDETQWLPCTLKDRHFFFFYSLAFYFIIYTTLR